MKLSNLPIGTRLGAGFALVLLMLIGVAYWHSWYAAIQPILASCGDCEY
jgi:hypothetical protein